MESECVAENFTYYVTGIMGTAFTLIFLFVALTINRLGRRNLIS